MIMVIINRMLERHAGKFVGKFEGQRVFESVHLGRFSMRGGYRGFSLPEIGIFVGEGVYTGNTLEGRAMLQHEFGHVLQYRMVGALRFYWVVGKESVMNCYQLRPYNDVPHALYWTETWANYLSQQYFGEEWLGLDTITPDTHLRYYPSANISKQLFDNKFSPCTWSCFLTV